MMRSPLREQVWDLDWRIGNDRAIAVPRPTLRHVEPLERGQQRRADLVASVAAFGGEGSQRLLGQNDRVQRLAGPFKDFFERWLWHVFGVFLCGL